MRKFLLLALAGSTFCALDAKAYGGHASISVMGQNLPPVVNPIPTIYINVPATAVTILGKATDPEGGVLKTKWTQVSGPNTAFIPGGGKDMTLTASGLIEGKYVFRLTATDDQGASASADGLVVVNGDRNLLTAWDWAIMGVTKNIGTTKGNDRGNRVASDAQGNAYVVGGRSRRLRKDGTIGELHGAHGGMDAYIAKYDSTGARLWIRTLGGSEDDEATALAWLPNGNLVVTGWFNKTASIPGTTVTSKGSQDIFLASISQDGDWAWLKSYGGTETDQGTAVHVTASTSEIFVGGWVGGNAQFGSSWTTGKGDRDCFMAKCDADGNAQWVRTVGSAGRDQATSIVSFQLGARSAVILGGFVQGSVDYNGASIPSLGGQDAFLYACNAGGTELGFKRFGGAGNDVINQVSFGPDPVFGFLTPRVWMAGTFEGTMTLPNGSTLTSAGQQDGFVAKFDISGLNPFAMRFGSTDNDGATDLCFNRDYLWITGFASYQQPGGPKWFGATDIFLIRIDGSGTTQQMLQAGGISADYGQGIATSLNRSVFVTGKFKYSSHFGPYEIGGRGAEEAFVGRITDNPLINFRSGQTEDVSVSYGIDPNKLTVGPNPAVSEAGVMVYANNFIPEGDEATVQILDITGKVVSSTIVAVTNGSVSAQVAAPAQAGLYIVRLEGVGVMPLTQRLSVK